MQITAAPLRFSLTDKSQPMWQTRSSTATFLAVSLDQDLLNMSEHTMRRTDRLFALMQILSDTQTHRAEDLARINRVSLRTLYRDIERLQTAGTQITGTRGQGYKLTPATVLPPLTLSDDEVEALQLGLAILLQSPDPDLRVAANSLAAKIDAGLPETQAPDATLWQRIENPFADAARGLGHLPTLRAAIKARQKVKLVYTTQRGTVETHTLHPQNLAHRARSWLLTGYSEKSKATETMRIDLITTADPLTELF